jgi:hypothetical protein
LNVDTKENVAMNQTYKESEMSPEDKALVDKFDAEYVPGVTIVKRSEPSSVSARKVNVYVDGLLQTMDEATLDRLIEIGFYVVVTRRP